MIIRIVYRMKHRVWFYIVYSNECRNMCIYLADGWVVVEFSNLVTGKHVSLSKNHVSHRFCLGQVWCLPGDCKHLQFGCLLSVILWLKAKESFYQWKASAYQNILNTSAESPPPEALFTNPLLLSPLHNDVAPQMTVLFTKYWWKNTPWRVFKNTYTNMSPKSGPFSKGKACLPVPLFFSGLFVRFWGSKFRIA